MAENKFTSSQLVKSLARLGVPFLRGGAEIEQEIKPEILLAALANSPEARLRLALIPLLLTHPEFSTYTLSALQQLPPISALTLRCVRTLDVDYVGDDLHKNELQLIIEQIAQELRIPVDAVPTGADTRRLLIGQFGNLEVYVLDPYTIALSKLDRGFETDIEVIHHNLITIDELERVALNALRQANGFALNTQAIRTHLQTVHALLG